MTIAEHTHQLLRIQKLLLQLTLIQKHQLYFIPMTQLHQHTHNITMTTPSNKVISTTTTITIITMVTAISQTTRMSLPWKC